MSLIHWLFFLLKIPVLFGKRRPLWESLPECKASILRLLRSDQWFASGDFVIVCPTESKLLMGTLQFGLLLSSLLSDCRRQALRKGFLHSGPPRLEHVRKLTCQGAPFFSLSSWPWWSSGGKPSSSTHLCRQRMTRMLHVHGRTASFTCCLGLSNFKKKTPVSTVFVNKWLLWQLLEGLWLLP